MTVPLSSDDSIPVVEVSARIRTVTAVVPVKPLALAKSRLTVSDELRHALVLAFAADTIAALAANPFVSGIVVVTTDPRVARSLDGRAVRLLRDDGTGLCLAVRAGGDAAASWWPGAGVLIVPADLPCLVPADVTAVLAAGQCSDGAFVPDRPGNGTTLLLSPPHRPVVTHYGTGSAASHRALGLRCLDDAPMGARHDVDTLVDLRTAAVIGFGPATTAVLSDVGGLKALRLQAS